MSTVSPATGREMATNIIYTGVYSLDARAQHTVILSRLLFVMHDLVNPLMRTLKQHVSLLVFHCNYVCIS